MGGTGVFVSALRDALLDGHVDLAVHSLKDLPSAGADGDKLVKTTFIQRINTVGGLSSARTVMSSLDFAELTHLQREERWDEALCAGGSPAPPQPRRRRHR